MCRGAAASDKNGCERTRKRDRESIAQELAGEGPDALRCEALGDPPPDPLGFSALVPIPKGEKNRAACCRPFGLGPWDGAQVGSHRCPILRPGREELYH